MRAHKSPRQPAQEEAEVVAGGGEHGIDAIAVAPFEIIAAHAVLGLDVADDRLDRGAPLHLAADRGGDAPDLAGDPDAELLLVIVAAIALVDMDAAGFDPGQLLQLGDDRPQRVAVERIAVQRLGMEHELTAFRLGRRRRDRHLAAELVRGSGLALADALDLGRMQRIDLRATLTMILEPHPAGQGEQVGEALCERIVPGDLAADVADHPAEPDAQELQFAPGALELVGMGVAADHDRRPLGHPPIALPQRHIVASRQIDQLLDRAVAEPRVGRVRDRLRLHRGVDHHALEIAGRQRPGLVRHRQALLDQGHQLLLAQPLAPMRQRRALERQSVAEAQFAAEELVIRVLQPARAQNLVRQVVHVLQDEQTRHQPRRQGGCPAPGVHTRWQTARRETPNRSRAPAAPADGRDR